MALLLLNTMLPIIVCIAIGWCWSKLKYDFNNQFVSRLVLTIGAPALILSVISTVEIDKESFSQLAVATVMVMLLMAIIGYVTLRAFSDRIDSYWSCFIFPNVGNMGLPICFFAYGDNGLAYALIIFMILSLLHFPVGILLAQYRVKELTPKTKCENTISSKSTDYTDNDALEKKGRGLLHYIEIIIHNNTTRLILRMPILYSILLTIFLLYTDLRLPELIKPTIDLIAGLTIPLMLITMGVSLANLSIRSWYRALFYSSIRLFIGAACGYIVGIWLNLPSDMAKVLILQSAMPVAIFNYLFALTYNKEANEIAGIVLISTILSLVWLPILIAILE